MLLEVCIDHPESVLAAAAGGADRLEVCANLAEGGTTPPVSLVEFAHARTGLPLMMMIRPRGGSFCYTEAEWDLIRRDLQQARSLPLQGVVLGMLTSARRIDAERLREALDLAGPLEVTFHRAFDLVQEPEAGLELLLRLGVKRLLTSGQAPKAPDGAALIRRLCLLAGDALAVMAGSGVEPGNVRQLAADTGVREVHASGRVRQGGTAQDAFDTSWHATDAARVRAIKTALAGL
ncbi:MAG: copper homeostasis protein CutC [Bacteroidia bacterium]|nr:copper homeostasis protein CutC [Bacteroidia bacterium]